MKIIPHNGHILVRYIGRGETTTESGVIIPEKQEMPKGQEAVSLRVLAIDQAQAVGADPPADDPIPVVAGQVVMALAMSIRPVCDDALNKNRGFIRWCEVIAVIEEEKSDAN